MVGRANKADLAARRDGWMVWTGQCEEKVSRRMGALGRNMGSTAVPTIKRQNPAGGGRFERRKRILKERDRN